MGISRVRQPQRRPALWMLGVMSAFMMLSAGALTASCDSRESPLSRPSGFYFGNSSGGDGGGFNVGDASGPPSPDASGLCGNEILPAIIDAPNLYFVLDTSGSMSAAAKGGTRYEAVRSAAVELVRSLNALINVGAALFPHKATDSDPCHPGAQVFPVKPGDPYTGMDGETTIGFRLATKVNPFGGTPTASTLAALHSTLVALPGKTIVLLATDGGPNCNEGAKCAAEECIANIEGHAGCSSETNCCAPNGPVGPSMCIDKQATLSAISSLSIAGIDVYVIGVPGSEVYSGVLDEMAVAGGTAQPGSPRYYSVSDLDELGSVLGGIASVVISCELTLSGPLKEKDLTNVYLDQEVLPYDEVNGWRWTSDAVIELRGEACERLKKGQVKQVQIVSGCPTEAAK